MIEADALSLLHHIFLKSSEENSFSLIWKRDVLFLFSMRLSLSLYIKERGVRTKRNIAESRIEDTTFPMESKTNSRIAPIFSAIDGMKLKTISIPKDTKIK